MANNRDKYARTRAVPLPSREELIIHRRNSEVGLDPAVPRRTASGRGKTYSMTVDQAMGAASLMDRSQVVSPLAGLPVSASSGEFAFARGVLGAATGEHGEWDEFWDDSQSGYDYENTAGQTVYDNEGEYVDNRPGWRITTNAANQGQSRMPAQISVLPTSTINPARPRTVAAGYDIKRLVLTVVFRDGTFYNYYGVEPAVWTAFKATVSKGRFIAEVLDFYGRGTASMAKSPVYAREQLYRVARTAQMTHSGSEVESFNPRTGKMEKHNGVSPVMQFDRSLPPRTNPTQSRRRNSAAGGGKPPRISTPAKGPSKRSR